MSKTRTITPNPPADFVPSKNDVSYLRPFRVWCQKVLPLVYDDSLSYYELLCKVVDYLNKTMEEVNQLGVDVSNLFNAFQQLQDYVNNYFDSLDVQEEINNKLDEMIEDGSFGLYLGKFIPYVTPEMFGAKGDGATDDYEALNSAITYGKCVFLSNKTYCSSKELIVPSNTTIMGATNSVLKLTAKTTIGGFLTVSEAENVVIKNIALDCFTPECPDNYIDNALGITKSHNVVIDGVFVIKSLYKGITLQQTVYDCVVTNCVINNCHNDGLTVEYSDCHDITISNVIINTTYRGLVVTGLEGNGIERVFINNVCCENSEHYGAYIWNAKNCNIEFSTYNDGSSNIQLQNVHDSSFRINANTAPDYGIRLIGCANVSITGSVSNNNARNITINTCDNISFKDVILEKAQYAVYIEDDSTNINFVRVNMSGTLNVGIYGLYNNYKLTDCILASVNNMPTGYNAIANGYKDYPITPSEGFTHYSDTYGSDIIRVFDDGHYLIRASVSGTINETNVLFNIPEAFRPTYYTPIHALALTDTIINAESVGAIVQNTGNVIIVSNIEGIQHAVLYGEYYKK